MCKKCIFLLLLGGLVGSFFFEARLQASESCELSLTVGVLSGDLRSLRALAQERRLHFFLLPSNPHSLKYQGQRGFRSKRAELKNCKSARRGPNAGLVECHPEAFENRAAWSRAVENLLQLGYQVLGPESNYLVMDQGLFFHSDYDLLGVYDESGRDAYTEELRQVLNESLGRSAFRHGPLDQYDHRFDIGVDFPLTHTSPDGENEILSDQKSFRARYESIGVDWSKIWNPNGSERHRENTTSTLELVD